MKRFSLVFAVFAVLLTCAGVATANFPSLAPPDTTVTVALKQGFYQNAQVWFFCTDTNDVNFASTYTYPYRMPTLSVPLTSAFDYDPYDPTAGAKMFVNTGYQQGPVFTAVPTQAAYSGIWSVIFIKWLPGKARLVTNTDPYNAVTNPKGFPVLAGPGKQADLLTTYGTSKAPVVVDCPIAAVGPLNDSVWPRDNSNPTVLYRLPQVVSYTPSQKRITLPAWYTYCQERLPDSNAYGSFFVDKVTVIIPDVQDPILADRLKANLAPGLGDIDPNNSQDFFFIDGRMFGEPNPFITGGPVGPLMKPIQYPILEWCPNGIGANNTNKGYVPIMDVLLLEGSVNFPTNGGLPFANSWPFVTDVLLPGMIYLSVPDERINAPVMDFFRIVRPQAGCSDCP